MQDLCLNLPVDFEGNDSVSEDEQSDHDVDEDCCKEFADASNICEVLIGEGTYILNVAATRTTYPKVGISTSNNIVQVFNLQDDFQDCITLNNNLNKTIDIKFCDNNENLLWTGTNNGICLWDLRIPDKVVSKFTDTTDEKDDKDRKINSFDISSCGRLLSAGTDTYEGDAFLLFWDIRNLKLAGAFWESHTDDITQVKFHPSNRNKMLSASTDGLINIYDLTQTCEDDALIDSLNTESSIEKTTWREFGNRDVISCITHTADVQLWRSEDVQPYCSFSRSDLARHLRRTSENYIYVVDIHVSEECAIILAGSNADHGKCARGLKLQNTTLKPNFSLGTNQQRLRCSWFNENNNLLLTGGEKGFLTAWKLTKEIV
ncbi:hypothetical protein WA026_013495 [Henosepilachna vigintioctopunctata]|uniref:WD repeat-containing protein 89 n=1 Tax=Henosepilachna vigintioctopunctata TaxID=420089 RepID=A0AAW1VG67_9CUCU